MSATRLLFNLMFGLTLAGGVLYANLHPELIRKLTMVQKSPGAKAPAIDPNAEIARLEREVDQAVNEGRSQAANPPAADTASREEAPMPTAQETLQAATALARRMNGQTQTGNEGEDRILQQLDAEESANVAPAPVVQASETRKPAATTVIEMDGTNGSFESDEDKINAMMVPDSVKKEILANYRRTGRMPVLDQTK